MSHDTDKLIRQLSLVAFLMAERRPLTARDIKSNVEGYQEMSDEAFARRFYSDRAELVALGVPLDSQRDEFTGEELYTLRSERYFLPELELDDEELAALQTCFYLLEGRFAYAEPLRLALQNLALGRSAGALEAAPTGTAVRVEVRDPDYSPELQGRLGKLEGAIAKQRTVRSKYWSIYRDEEEERTLNPYALLPENGSWYVIGHDLDRDDIRTFRVSRIRSDIRFATRRERDFRLPAEFDIELYRGRTDWQVGDIVGEATITAQELVERFSIPAEQLEEHLSLLNLVNFGGGCYAVYAELQGDQVHVDKELFGDTFRRPPRLTPLEARAIRLALEFVGPMIAAGAHSPLDRVRAKLEETFGAFALAQTPTPHGGAEEDLVASLSRAIADQKLVELEYLKPDSMEVETRTVEPYKIERRLPHWYVHTWDTDRDAARSYRLDRMRKAKATRKTFEPREGCDPAELHETTKARGRYAPRAPGWRGARAPAEPAERPPPRDRRPRRP